MTQPQTPLNISKCHNAPVVLCEGAAWDVDPASLRRGSTYHYGCTECHEACDLATPPNEAKDIDVIISPLEAIDNIREKIADICRTGHYGIAETKVVNELFHLLQQEKKEAERMTHVSYKRMAEAIIYQLGQDHPIQAQSIIDFANTAIAEQEQS